eukprot:scaffold662945_cov85-Prasinocladus_malaysianus.AAC.1
MDTEAAITYCRIMHTGANIYNDACSSVNNVVSVIFRGPDCCSKVFGIFLQTFKTSISHVYPRTKQGFRRPMILLSFRCCRCCAHCSD